MHVVLQHALRRIIIPSNLGLDRRRDKGDGFNYPLSVTSDYTPIRWKTLVICDVTTARNGSEDVLGHCTHADLNSSCEPEITNKTFLLRRALQTCIGNSVSGAAM